MDNLKQINEIAETLRKLAKDMETLVESTEDKTEVEDVKISLEEIREVLANKAVDHREEVKALLDKFGANKLTEVDPSNYQELKQKVEAI